MEHNNFNCLFLKFIVICGINYKVLKKYEKKQNSTSLAKKTGLSGFYLLGFKYVNTGSSKTFCVRRHCIFSSVQQLSHQILNTMTFLLNNIYFPIHTVKPCAEWQILLVTDRYFTKDSDICNSIIEIQSQKLASQCVCLFLVTLTYKTVWVYRV